MNLRFFNICWSDDRENILVPSLPEETVLVNPDDDLIDAAKNNDQNGLLRSWLSDAYGVDAISFDFELIKCEDDFDDDIVNIEE